MRTTLVLDDELVQQAKHHAVDANITLSEFVNRTLRQALGAAGDAAEGPFSMVTYGPEGSTVHHEPADFAAVAEADDRTALGRD